MLSNKLRSIMMSLELAADAKATPTRPFLQALYRQQKDALEEALRMEQQVIPRRQKLTAEDMKSGKVVCLPIYPRDEAVLP
jgi:hypothetical protein